MRALLIEDGRSHNVRGSALVALIRVQLRYGCHVVVPELATAYDTGLFDEILARFLQIVPTLKKSETQSWIALVAEPIHSIGDRTMAYLGSANSFDRIPDPTHSLLDTDAPEQPGPGEKNP